MARRRRQLVGGAALVALLASAGCDRAQVLDLVATAADDSADERGGVGTLRGLQVLQTASAVARRLSTRRAPGCRVDLSGDQPFTYTVELTLERERPDGTAPLWRETRTLRRDAGGDLGLQMVASFRTELGLTGERSAVWRLVDEQVYLSSDGRRFWQREPTPDERERLIGTGFDPLQAAIAAAGSRWRGRPGGPWRAGGAATGAGDGAPLFCAPVTSRGEPFVRQFDARATLLDAELGASGEPLEALGGSVPGRRLEARWQLDDGARLTARVSDTFTAGASPVEPPDAASVVEVGRDRSMHRARELFEGLVREGLAAPAPAPTPQEEDR